MPQEVNEIIKNGTYWDKENNQKPANEEGRRILANKNTSDSLFARWKIYSNIFLVCAIIFITGL